MKLVSERIAHLGQALDDFVRLLRVPLAVERHGFHMVLVIGTHSTGDERGVFVKAGVRDANGVLQYGQQWPFEELEAGRTLVELVQKVVDEVVPFSRMTTGQFGTRGPRIPELDPPPAGEERS